MSTISILVTRPSPFKLPPVYGTDEEGKRVVVHQELQLRPGANRVPAERWLAALDHPTVKLHCDVGTLRDNASAAEVTEHTHAPDALNGLTDLTVAKARPWIAASKDLEQLAKWRNIETSKANRRSIIDALDARAEELDEETAGSTRAGG
ncbi:hypothetical protein COW64_19895 [bacterium (Candidatus Blackallbacteria) CG18_big_fil_WC_8_21_14_2_50_49_26]|nr:MAG: hypothetical protein COW64_19895 [bacterium (Candidatus Blackallbacteria) CG18_big_fil_WC_8_21_14_2_50_49_26]